MAEIGAKWRVLRSILMISSSFVLASMIASAERSLKQKSSTYTPTESSESAYISQFVNFLWQSNRSGYQHVWPVMIGCILNSSSLGFCSTSYLDFKWWFAVTSTKAFFKGVDTWKKETIMKKEAAKRLEANEGAEYKLLPSGPNNGNPNVTKGSLEPEVSIIENVCWKELGLLIFVWVTFLALQIVKTHTVTCSTAYWILNLLQIPVSVGVTLYEAISLYKGHRVIASKGEDGTNFHVHQLALYCFCGVVAGMVGGLLGLGGGFILGPLFLELGVPPQVSSATATFAMTFSSSMSVIEYYLLKRFPIPYALYFMAVATIAALIGQHVVRRLIIILGRASLIIFILAFTIFVSAISLGGIGIVNMIGKIQRHEYMGFENLCKYDA